MDTLEFLTVIVLVHGIIKYIQLLLVKLLCTEM